jgi:hypothetical protein
MKPNSKVELLSHRHADDKAERKYSSYSFLTSTLDGVSDQRHALAALYPLERPSVPTGQEAGWASELVWAQRLEGKSFASVGDRTYVVRSSSL